jgi:hypothetical protein
MKRLTAAALAASLLIGPSLSSVWAQSAQAPKTRAQVIAERDEYFRTHRWDACLESWVVKDEFKVPEVSCSRDEVRKERDDFLRANRWDPAAEAWVPIKPQPRDLSGLTRDQVKRETIEFLRTHEWDNEASAWREKPDMRKPRS